MSIAADASDSSSYRWWVLVVVMIGTLMGAIDSSIVNVSIPVIMADFGSPLDDIEWVVTGYMLAFSALMPITAWLKTILGPKKLYMMSLFVFVLGSLLCGLAWDLPSLVAARIIQALGGGALTPIGLTMISEVFSPAERGKAMGYWGVGVIVGPAFGPTLGGYLTHDFGWRSIFLVNLPIGAIGIFLASAILHADKPARDARQRFDFWGFIFLTIFLIAFLLGLSQGEKEGWTSPYIVTCAILAFFSFGFFLVVELNSDHGILDLSLFRSRIFGTTIFVTVIRSIALFGAVFLQPLFLQQHMGLDEIDSGLVLLPGALVIGFFMPIAGKLSDKIGPRIPVIIGMISLAIFMFMYRDLDANTTMWDFIKPTLVRGLGLGMLMAPVMAAALNAVSKQKAAMASTMLNLMTQIGGSIGIAVLSMAMSHRLHYHLAVVGETARSASASFAANASDLMHRALQLGYTHAESAAIAKQKIGAHLAASASISAFQDAFIIGGCLALVSLIPAFLLPNKPSVHTPGEPVIME